MSFFDVKQKLHDTSIDIILNITWTNQYLLTSLTKDIHINIACERQTFLLAHHHWGTFREEEPLPLSDRNSILMTKINVYIINPVVMVFQNANLLNFTFLLVDFGKILCSSANELQQNSNATNIDCFQRFIAFTFDLCGLLSFVGDERGETSAARRLQEMGH